MSVLKLKNNIYIIVFRTQNFVIYMVKSLTDNICQATNNEIMKMLNDNCSFAILANLVVAFYLSEPIDCGKN